MSRKRLALCSIFLLVACFFVGCQAKGSKVSVDSTTICIDEDGSVTHKIVEPFTKEYYNVDALSEMIEEEVNEYNEEKGMDAILVDSVEIVENKESLEKMVCVTMVYASDKEYREFNDAFLYMGTVREAREEGYDILLDLYSAKDTTKVITKEEKEKIDDSLMVIFDEGVQLSLDKEILYFGEDCDLISKYMVKKESMSGHTYVILK